VGLERIRAAVSRTAALLLSPPSDATAAQHLVAQLFGGGEPKGGGAGHARPQSARERVTQQVWGGRIQRCKRSRIAT
jgi:hypothetical protein